MRSKVVVLAVLATSSIGCDGAIQSPVPGQPGLASVTKDCPEPDETIPRTGCPGFHLNFVKLTCGGDGKVAVSQGKDAGSATRIEVRIADDSVFTAQARPINPACVDGIPIDIGITLGVIYTANQGTEPLGSSTVNCITRSHLFTTQFITKDPLIANFPGIQLAIENELHQLLDREVAAIFGGTGRCARWVPLT